MEQNQTAATETQAATDKEVVVVGGKEYAVVKSKIEAIRKLAFDNDYVIETTKAETKTAAPVHILYKLGESDGEGNVAKTEIGRRTSTDGIEKLLNETLYGKPEKAPKAPRAPSNGTVKSAINKVKELLGTSDAFSELGDKVATALFKVSGLDNLGEAFSLKKSDFTNAESISVSTGYALSFEGMDNLLAAAKRLKLDVTLAGAGPSRLSLTFGVSTRPVAEKKAKDEGSSDSADAADAKAETADDAAEQVGDSEF